MIRHFAAAIRKLRPGQVLIIGFFAVIVLGTVLLTLPIATQNHHSVGLLPALFTSTSAVCVTGLTVVNTGLTFSLFGKIVILLLIQFGGLGFMTVTSLIFLAIGRRFSLKDRLIIQESFSTDSLQGMVQLIKKIVSVTLIAEGAGAIVLGCYFIPAYGPGKGLFHSIFTSISAFCNAGFDEFGFNNSIEPFIKNPLVNITIMVLVTVGGLGFAVILDIIQNRRFSKLMLHSRVVLIMSGSLFLFGFLCFALLEWNNPQTLASNNLNPGEKLMAAAFQSVTCRTAGFDTIGQGDLTPASTMISTVLMFIGASPASTGGGIKTTTFFIILLSVWSISHSRQDYNFQSRRLSFQLVRRAIAVFCLALGLVLIITTAVSGIEFATGGTKDLGRVLFESTSAFGTVGLSTGITSSLHPVSQVLLIITMFIGRLGPMTVSTALGGDPSKGNCIRFPEDKLMVG